MRTCRELYRLHFAGDERGHILLATNAVTFLTAVAAFVQTLRNGKQITTVLVSLDGRMTELLNVSKIEAHAAGKLEGKSEQ